MERSAILRHLLASKQLALDVSIIDLARQTAGFVAGDLASLVIRTELRCYYSVSYKRCMSMVQCLQPVFYMADPDS